MEVFEAFRAKLHIAGDAPHYDIVVSFHYLERLGKINS